MSETSATNKAENSGKKENPGKKVVRKKPKIGDSRPAPQPENESKKTGGKSENRRRRSRKNTTKENVASDSTSESESKPKSRRRSQSKRRRKPRSKPVEQIVVDSEVELNEKDLKARRGRSRKGRPVGRYLMVVSRQEEATHIAILEGRTLVEYYVSRPTDNVSQIHGNIYLGKVQNVLPGMEAAFVDIGTPKNAVIYRGDVQYDKDDFDGASAAPKIEQILKARQGIVCQVTKNPIAHKGARLTSEVSLPGRFVVFVPESDTFGISKRLPDSERKRLRQILDKVKPKGHGLIVRTAAENITKQEIERDIIGLVEQWEQIKQLASKSKAPSLLYHEPDMSVRVIREEFNKEYRGVVIDDSSLYKDVSEYVSIITPALADRVEHYDPATESLPLFERYHVQEQLAKALDRMVWLPSGGSLVIEATEALTVIDINTGKNVGKSNLEDTVFRNNLEAAEEIAHQLRLRDIGGIIVIDFVDMESKQHREEVVKVFKKALSRDKTRTQVYAISELGLVEMTRKRIGEGLIESLSAPCEHCNGRGLDFDADPRTKVVLS